MVVTDRRVRGLLIAGAVALVAIHVYAAVGHSDGGWVEQYGFPAALVDFFDVSFRDPLLTAGVSDFAVLIVAFAVAMFAVLPAAERWTTRTAGWLVVYVVFPGLGALLAPLWLRIARPSAYEPSDHSARDRWPGRADHRAGGVQRS